MATKEKANPTTANDHRNVELKEIVSNVAQSRGMGCLSQLQDQGYGMFEKEGDKPALWRLLTSDKPEERKQVVTLIDTYEPDIVELADDLKRSGQLQPIGVRRLTEGWDVVFGMRRAAAMAYNHCRYGTSPDTVQAAVLGGKHKAVELKLLARSENNARLDESPIDKAITYKFLKDEGGMDYEEIGKRCGVSHQTVRNHLHLLGKELEDKQVAIHTGKMSIDHALKLRQKRIDASKGGSQAEGSRTPENRHRLPSAKGVQKIYEAKHKPEKMSQKEWDLWTLPDVRKFIAFKLGLRYSEFKEGPPEADDAPKPAGKGGKGAKADKSASNGEGHKVLAIPRAKAKKLLISLGMAGAQSYSDELLASKCESLVNLVEDGQVAETEPLQKLQARLVEGYKEGLKVRIKD